MMKSKRDDDGRMRVVGEISPAGRNPVTVEIKRRNLFLARLSLAGAEGMRDPFARSTPIKPDLVDHSGGSAKHNTATPGGRWRHATEEGCFHLHGQCR